MAHVCICVNAERGGSGNGLFVFLLPPMSDLPPYPYLILHLALLSMILSLTLLSSPPHSSLTLFPRAGGAGLGHGTRSAAWREQLGIGASAVIAAATATAASAASNAVTSASDAAPRARRHSHILCWCHCCH